MPRTALQYKQIKDERKISILEAALPLFAINKEKVTIDLISKEAKCSHGLIYHYFKNVDDVLEELLSSETNHKLKDKLFLDEAGELATNLIHKIVVNLYDISSKEDICFALILMNETGKKSLFYKLTNLVSRGQKEGPINGGDPADIVACFFLLLKGYFLSRLLNKKTNLSKPSIDNVMNIFKRSSF